MGLFDDLKGSAKKSGVSGGSAALSAALSDPAGNSSIYMEKSKRERESGKKSAGKRSGAKSGGAAVIPFDDRGAASPDNGGSADMVKKYTKGSPAGDVVTGGLSVDLLPVSVDDVGRLLPVWVAAWCQDHDIQDVRKVSPLVFGSLCVYIGKHIKASRILKDKTRAAAGACVGSTCNRYDPAAVVALLDIFRGFCLACDKVPFSSAFADFCGVSLSYVREYTKQLTSSGLDIAKKTHDVEMDSIRQKTSADPVGRLAILNNEYYSGGVAASGSDHVAVSLPASGVFGLIGSEKID